MNILIIYAHPEPQSMNGSLFKTAVSHLNTAGHTVQTSDLHGMNFFPVPSREDYTTVLDPSYFKQQLEEIHATEMNGFSQLINQEQEKVEWSDLIIFQFPLTWFSFPAILKGWIDRVFAMGRFYRQGHFYDKGIFTEKKAVLSLTTGGAAEAYLKGGFNGDINAILRPLHRGILQFVGFSVLQPHIVYGPARKSSEELIADLENWKQRLSGIFNENAIDVGPY